MKSSKKNSPKSSPLVSIVTPSFNQGEFLEDAIKSILAQTYKNIEHVVVDGLSSYNTIEILKRFKHIRWISEKDHGYWDGITKAVEMAKGKYVTICMASDGYLNRDWIKQCVEVLENDSEVSLVWGFPRWLEDGKLTDVCFPHFHRKGAPQKFDWFPRWLMTGECLPNGNFVIRKDVFKKINTATIKTPKGQELFDLNYNFNAMGYLPYNLPVIAEFGREHPGQIGRLWTQKGWIPKAIARYNNQIKEYRKALIARKKSHVFRDSNGDSNKKQADLGNVNKFNEIIIKIDLYSRLIAQRVPTKLSRRIRSFLVRPLWP